MTHLLIAGLPGVGKSNFCTWLAEERGFHHIDVDRTTDPDVCRLLSDPRNASEIVSLLNRRASPIVIDWGFPPRLLVVVKALADLGVMPWWFGGDRSAACDAYRAREAARDGNQGAEAALQYQLGQIDQAWQEIESVFAGRIIDTVLAGPIQPQPGEHLRAAHRSSP